MKKTLSILAIAYCLSANAQSTTFQKSFGGTNEEYCYDAHQTSDGGYVFGGVTLSYPTNNIGNSYVVKTDNIGDTLWTSVFGDICGSIHYVNDIVQTSDNGYLTCGGEKACSASEGGNIVRLDSNGNVVWAKTCSYTEDPYPCIQDKAGNYIVGGYVTGIGAGMLDGCIMKLNKNGDTIWSRTYGGASNDWFYHIEQTTDGGYIASGFTSSFGQGDTDIYVVKTDSNGKVLWSNAYGTATYNESAFGHSIQVTKDGGYIVAGSTGNTQGVFLMKLDGAGNMKWAKQYDGSYGHAVKQTKDGGYVVTGQNQLIANGVEMFKTDSLGNVMWSKIYNAGSSRYEGFFLDLTKDGGYVTGGENTDGTNFRDMYIVKTDSMGNSGCNEVNPVITSENVPFIQASAATIVGVGANTVTDPYRFYRQGNITDFCLITGINEPDNISTNISVAPNPAKNQLTITSTLPIESLTIVNVLGETMFKSSFAHIRKNIFKCNVSDMEAGVYFLTVLSEGKTTTKKVVITK